MDPIIHITVYSSVLFFTNYLHALTQEYSFYAILFLGLTVSSVLQHSNNFANISISESNETKETKETKETNETNETKESKETKESNESKSIIKLVDKVFCYSVIFYGGYMLVTKLQKICLDEQQITREKIILLIIIFSTFLAVIFLFHSEKKYSFSENLHEAYYWHAFLHFISSVGHHCIIFL